MADSKKTDPNETAKPKSEMAKILEKAYGPGCDPKSEFLNGVNPRDAHQFYEQICAATEALESKYEKDPGKALGFLRNALRRLNETIK